MYARSKGGLCNRFKTLISVLRMDPNNKIWWQQKRITFCKFSSLFSNDFAVYDRPTGKRGKEYYSGWRFFLFDEEKAMLPPDMDFIDFEYEKIPEKIISNILETLNILKPSKRVTREVASFCELFDEDTVSVHLRCWVEKCRSTKHRRRKFRMEKYYEILDEMPDKKFFVATDSKGGLKLMIERYGQDRIIARTQPRSFTIEGNIASLIDLLLLSKNDTIVGSFHSTFTEMAWWFGGCKSKVILVGC